MRLVGISGKRGVGKSLLASILVSKYGFTEVSFAGPLKAGVRRDFNLKYEHTDGALKEVKLPNGLSPRELMVLYGQFFRNIQPDFWVDKLMQEIKHNSDLHLADRFVIPDVRFENEHQAVRSNGGYLVRLNRLAELNMYKDPAFTKDPSECDLDDYLDWNLVVNSQANKTPRDLELVADRIVEALNGR